MLLRDFGQCNLPLFVGQSALIVGILDGVLLLRNAYLLLLVPLVAGQLSVGKALAKQVVLLGPAELRCPLISRLLLLPLVESLLSPRQPHIVGIHLLLPTVLAVPASLRLVEVLAVLAVVLLVLQVGKHSRHVSSILRLQRRRVEVGRRPGLRCGPCLRR